MDWLTVADVEAQTGIPNATIRRYIRYHGHHLPQRKTGKSYMVDAQAMHVFQQIRDMYQRGLSTDQVEETLANMGSPMTITVHDEQVTVSTSEAIQRLQVQMTHDMENIYRQFDELKQTVELSREEIAATRAENVELRSLLEERLSERDHKLTEALAELREQREEWKRGMEQYKKRSWWRFGR